MASTESFAMDKFPSAKHVEAKHCPPIAPLGEAPLPLQEIRAGVMGSLVGLLPGRCPKIMDKYLPVREMRDGSLSLGLASFGYSHLLPLSLHSFFLYVTEH